MSQTNDAKNFATYSSVSVLRKYCKHSKIKNNFLFNQSNTFVQVDKPHHESVLKCRGKPEGIIWRKTDAIINIECWTRVDCSFDLELMNKNVGGKCCLLVVFNWLRIYQEPNGLSILTSTSKLKIQIIESRFGFVYYFWRSF